MQKEESVSKPKSHPSYGLFYFINLYWQNSKKSTNLLLLTTLIIVSIVEVLSEVGLNKFQNYLYSSLQNYAFHRLVFTLLIVFFLISIYAISGAFSNYLAGFIGLKWRQQLTTHFSKLWLSHHNYHHLNSINIDNPEQRITDDMANLPIFTLQIGIQIFLSSLMVASFIFVLWKLSEEWVIKIGGVLYHCPGFYVYAILLYAIIFNIVVFFKGHNLINLNYSNQALTANFRFNMSLIREHSESVRAQKLEGYYQSKLAYNFSRIFRNSLDILRLQRLIAIISDFYMGQSVVILGVFLALPAYLIKHLSIGYLIQVSAAAISLNLGLAVLVGYLRKNSSITCSAFTGKRAGR